VTFAVDGFSGLAAFRALPLVSIKFLKIDSSLLNNIGGSRLDFALVKAITDVARALHIETVAKQDTAKLATDLDGIEFDLIQPCPSSAPLHEIALHEQEHIAGAEVG
jgi:EAL domain-containing protein (putative c-di-GMP-specific phosphodiesterase class I)